MSTYVFISRCADPFDDGGAEISIKKWLKCADFEPGFRAPAEAENEWLGAHARIWSGHSIPLAFGYIDGQVMVKNPERKRRDFQCFG